jgi:hypothetical protein
MWPFIICKEPLHGRQQAASWDGPYGRIHVYVDPRCPRITFGQPTQHLMDRVLPEFVEIAIGKTKNQVYTTRIPIEVLPAERASAAGYELEEAHRSGLAFSLFGTSQRTLQDIVRFYS